MKSCPKCLGSGEVFDGEDFSACNLCDSKGKVKNNVEYEEHLFNDED